MGTKPILLAIILFLVSQTAANGSTIIPPADYGDMILLSDAVLKVEVGEAVGVDYGGLVYTRVSVKILQSFKGGYQQGDVVHIFHLGGVIGDMTAIVPGSPMLSSGEIVLLSLRESEIGLHMWLLSYGQLRFKLLPDGTEVYKHLDSADGIEYELGRRTSIEIPGSYRKQHFEQHIHSILSGQVHWDSQMAGSIQLVKSDVLASKATSTGSHLPAGCSMLDANGGYSRWPSLVGQGSVRVFTQNDATLADRSAIQQAISNWGSITGTSLGSLQFGGLKSLPQCDASGLLTPLRTQILDENELFVAYNDPCGNLEPAPNCVGILATAQHYVSNQSHTHRGTNWANLSKGIVIVNKGIQSCLTAARFQQTIQHEIGHLLGFGHHTIEPANMNAACCNPITAKDIACAQFVYSNMLLKPTPVIARIIPDVVSQGTTLTVVIEGAGFLPESAVAIGGNDVQIEEIKYIHDNRMEVTVVVLRSAIPSSRAFRVTNPTPGGGRSQDMAFTVVASTAIPEHDEDGVPYRFSLGDNFPNPFNPSTSIPFEIPWQTWIRMSLVDATGRTTRLLIDKEYPAGRHVYYLKAEGLPSGLHIVRLETELGVIFKKITLSK